MVTNDAELIKYDKEKNEITCGHCNTKIVATLMELNEHYAEGGCAGYLRGQYKELDTAEAIKKMMLDIVSPTFIAISDAGFWEGRVIKVVGAVGNKKPMKGGCIFTLKDDTKEKIEVFSKIEVKASEAEIIGIIVIETKGKNEKIKIIALEVRLPTKNAKRIVTDDEILSILDKEIIPAKRFGFDFDEEGRALHGIFVANLSDDPEPALLRSDHKLIQSPMFRQYRLKFTEYPPYIGTVAKYYWNRTEIKNWLVNKPTISDVAELYQDVRKYIKKNVYHPDEATYDVAACYVLASHLWAAFDSFPRLFIVAKPDSGKSQQVRAFRNLVFKPTPTGDATKAALVRIANTTGGVLLFDNFDNLPEEQKQGIIHFIEISYQGDLPSFRAEDGVKGKGKVPTSYSAHCPVILATVDTTCFSLAAISRGLFIVMERSPSEQKYPELPDTDPDVESTLLRNKLYSWGIESVPETKKKARAIIVNDFDNRQAQISRPLIYVAGLIGEDTKNTVIAWLKTNFKTHHAEEEFSDFNIILQALYEKVKEDDFRNFSFKVRDIAEKVLEDLEIQQVDSQGRKNDRYTGTLNKWCQKVSKVMKSIPNAERSNPCNKTTYTFKPTQLVNYFKRYNLWEQNTVNTLNTVNSFNTNNTPNTLNNNSNNTQTLD